MPSKLEENRYFLRDFEGMLQKPSVFNRIHKNIIAINFLQEAHK